MRNLRRKRPSWTRRSFLQTVGVTAPTLSLVLERAASAGQASAPALSEKSTPVDLGRFFNASSRDFGPREQARRLGGEIAGDGLLRTPAGRQTLRGLPFRLGPDSLDEKRWVLLSTRPGPGAARSVEVPLDQPARFVCLATFCEWDEGEGPGRARDAGERVGETLAEVALVHDDGRETRLPLRRRFEVHSPSYSWGRMAFASRPHRMDAPRGLTDPLSQGTDWGELQQAIADNAYSFGGLGMLWISALANPRPDRPLRALRLEARSQDVVALCGLTLFRGQENPLRFERLCLYRLTLPEPAGEPGRWRVEVDLGIVGRTFSPREFSPEAWLQAPDAGLGERTEPLDSRELYVEVTASPEATLVVTDTRFGQRFEFDLARIEPGRPLEARSGDARVEVVERERVWVHGRVLDAATQRPTAARIAFRSKEGRYIPPYGHRSEINTGWFQDYGADVAVGDASFAYVDGTFQVELPVGEVYVELSKGFEYSPVRRRLAIEPSQRELVLEVSRFTNLRAKGWVTADTHVHFLSPSTAVLEGQAEGLNLVSLLAAQWGDLFTNVGDLAHGPLVSRDGETTVQVNTENRQHLLGHLGLVGGHGAPVFPMSASGPGESYLGDPLWTSLGDWADQQRAREGLVVAVHFPYPNGELAADIALEQDRRAGALPLRGRLRHPPLPRLVPLPRRRVSPPGGGRDRQDGGLHAGRGQPHLCPPGRGAVQLRELGPGGPRGPDVHDDGSAPAPRGRRPDPRRRDPARPGRRPGRGAPGRPQLRPVPPGRDRLERRRRRVARGRGGDARDDAAGDGAGARPRVARGAVRVPPGADDRVGPGDPGPHVPHLLPRPHPGALLGARRRLHAHVDRRRGDLGPDARDTLRP